AAGRRASRSRRPPSPRSVAPREAPRPIATAPAGCRPGPPGRVCLPCGQLTAAAIPWARSFGRARGYCAGSVMRIHRPFVALVAAALVLPVVLAADGGTVRFVTPRNHATVVGVTPIEVQVEGSVERVEIAVDGKPLATLTAPPFRMSWDAGDASSGHVLQATAFFADGTRAKAQIATSALKVEQVEEVALVNLYAVVTDSQGNYVNDLAQKDFRIQENGRMQAIERFSADRKPLKVALVIDSSYSMSKEGRLQAAREASRDFLNALAPGDESMIVSFSDAVQFLQGLTADRKALTAAVDQTKAEGGTALYDAIY